MALEARETAAGTGELSQDDPAPAADQRADPAAVGLDRGSGEPESFGAPQRPTPDASVDDAAPTAQDPPPFHVEPSAGDSEAPALRHVEPDDQVSGAAPQGGDAPALPVERGDGDPAGAPPAQNAPAGPPEPDDSAPEAAPQARDAAVVPVDQDHGDHADPAGAPPAHNEPLPAPDGVPRDAIAPGVLSPHFDRARVLTIANQKGGVGKTTTAVSVSAALAELGSRVLLVDLDPQGNATSGVGVKVAPNHPTIYDVLVREVDLEDAIEPTNVRNLFVVPANLDLAGAEIELVSAFSREQKLRNALEPIRAEYDIVLIDCPPSLGLLTVNALSAGDGLLVPIQCEYYALEGLGALRRNAELIRTQLNPDLDITGFVLTMLDARTRLSQQVVDEVRAHFGDKVFNSRIPRSVRLAEAPGFGQPITVFDPGSRGSMAYRRLAAELLERLITNGPPPDRRTEGAPA